MIFFILSATLVLILRAAPQQLVNPNMTGQADPLLSRPEGREEGRDFLHIHSLSQLLGELI